MIDRLESDWLGPWKGLLLGCPVDEKYQHLIKESAAHLRKEIKSTQKVMSGLFDREIDTILSLSFVVIPIF
jgi:hypothetical protein